MQGYVSVKDFFTSVFFSIFRIQVFTDLSKSLFSFRNFTVCIDRVNSYSVESSFSLDIFLKWSRRCNHFYDKYENLLSLDFRMIYLAVKIQEGKKLHSNTAINSFIFSSSTTSKKS